MEAKQYFSSGQAVFEFRKQFFIHAMEKYISKR